MFIKSLVPWTRCDYNGKRVHKGLPCAAVKFGHWIVNCNRDCVHVVGEIHHCGMT